jgi:biotin-(acetyl-CoA carboxylase) ligase
VFEEWKGYLETLGQRVKVIGVGVAEEGVAQDVAPDGRLLLLRKDGQRVEVPAGEVSVLLWS